MDKPSSPWSKRSVTRKYVCSIHFIDGKLAKDNPVPTLFISGSISVNSPSKSRKPPLNRKFPVPENHVENQDKKKNPAPAQHIYNLIDKSYDISPSTVETNQVTQSTQTHQECVIPMSFVQLTRECDVRFFTGFKTTSMFKIVFGFVKLKASIVTWDGNEKNCFPEFFRT